MRNPKGKDTRRVYYSHAIPKYGKKAESAEKRAIRANLPRHVIIDPNLFKEDAEKNTGKDEMDYWLSLVETCDVLVFTRYLDEITAGVGKEVNHALTKGIEVYELEGSHLRRVMRTVKHLSVKESRELYLAEELRKVRSSGRG